MVSTHARCCCDLFRIQSACSSTPTTFGVGAVPAAGRYFWGNNYTDQGFSANVLYYISTTQMAGLTRVEISDLHAFTDPLPLATEGIGIDPINGCHVYTATPGSIEMNSWRYHGDASAAANYAGMAKFGCAAINLNSGEDDHVSWFDTFDCVPSGDGFSTGDTESRFVYLVGKKYIVTCGIGQIYLKFYGEIDAPDRIDSGDILNVTNLLTPSASPVFLNGLDRYPIGENGTMKLYF